jgi:hypothetical protein
MSEVGPVMQFRNLQKTSGVGRSLHSGFGGMSPIVEAGPEDFWRARYACVQLALVEGRIG